MREENAIEVKDLKKQFKVYYDKGSQLKEKMLFWKRNRYENRQVLNGISFEVKKGEAVGLIGHNGCGKSTTLKLLTKIIYPTSGTVEMRGRVSSLIELGAGFHPDMSGRENIYTNAAIFGLSKREIEERLDTIIEFSELQAFIDNPVRTYSSGMYMRLAFAVAINVNADILLIDEILAVGDANFQAKCFDKLKELRDSDKTIVIVSHSLDTVKDLCTRAVWIYKGEFKLDGDPTYVIDEYLKQVKLDHKEEAKKKYQKPLDTYHGIVVVDIPQSFAEVKKDTAQFTISGWSLSDCLNDRLKVTFDDQEVTEMRKINRSDVLMAYQEKYGGYGTNDDECGFDYFVDVSQMELGEHSILVQLLDEKDKVISEKDLKINII
jgi:ABC-type polysaccharide/polyol phosphate transport system ATPase subunit